MQIVYFPKEFHSRAPEMIGQLCAAPTNEWVSLGDVINCVQAGETVTIRPASEAELERVEGYVALYEIGYLLGAQLGALLDKDAPEDVSRAKTAVENALRSIDIDLRPIVSDAPAGISTASVNQ